MVPEFRLHFCCGQKALKALGGTFQFCCRHSFFIYFDFFLCGSASSHLRGKDSPGVLCLIHMCRSTTWRTDRSIAWGCGWVGGPHSLIHGFPSAAPSSPPPSPASQRLPVGRHRLHICRNFATTVAKLLLSLPLSLCLPLRLPPPPLSLS